jgi:ectoine hydroxylase-related dioxygenase (phytanoyl-CoA dioxygenase family)
MPAGSALVYSGRVIHSGGRNETDDLRIGLYFGYVPTWLRPLENAAQLLPESVSDALVPDTRRMLGFYGGGFDAVL